MLGRYVNLRTVEPIQVPVLQAVDGVVTIDVRTQLVARSAPTELPAPVSLKLVGECIGLYVIKGQPFKFWIR